MPDKDVKKILFEDLSEKEQEDWLEDFARTNSSEEEKSTSYARPVAGREKYKGAEGGNYESTTFLDPKDTKRLLESNALGDVVRKYSEETGRPVNEIFNNLGNVTERRDPTQASGMYDDGYELQRKEYTQSYIADFAESVYDSFVLNTMEGYANLIPTVAMAFGSSKDEMKEDWKTDWVNTVSGFVDTLRPRLSDDYYKGDYDRKVTVALGNGLGFIGGIFAGGGLVAKGLGKLGMVNKAIKYDKAGRVVGRAGQTSQWAQRWGHWIQGTNMMYPMIYKQARQNEINPADAARISLSIAGVVSATEGIALEWIGKGIAKGAVQKTSQKILKEELKNISVRNVDDAMLLQQRVVSGLGNKLRAMKIPITTGAAIEFGQEYSQTYIEEGMKQMYDTMVAAEGTKKGKGQFGSDININTEQGWWTFKHAWFSGMIGGILGGGLGGGRALVGGVRQETAYGYIESSVDKKDGGKKDLGKLQTSLNELVQSGNITQKAADNAKVNIDKMTKFANATRGLDIRDGVASYQAFQISDLHNTINEKIDNTFGKDENLPKAIYSVYAKNRKMGAEISNAMNNDLSEIVENKEAYTKNKTKYENRLKSYSALAQKVVDNKIEEEEFAKELKNITDDVSDKTKRETKKNKKSSTKTKTPAEILAEAENKAKIQELEKIKEEKIAKVTDQFIEDGDVAKKEETLKKIEEEHESSIKELELAAVELDEETKEDVKEEVTPETKVDETPIEGEQQATESVESKKTEIESKREEALSKIDKEKNSAVWAEGHFDNAINEINAKYDAELAALESTQQVTEDVEEAKKTKQKESLDTFDTKQNGSETTYTFKNKQGERTVGVTFKKMPNGDIQVQGIEVEKKARRQGIAEEVYNILNREAQKSGGTVTSQGNFTFSAKDKSGRSIAPARKLWDKLIEKGEAEIVQEGMPGAPEIKQDVFRMLPPKKNVVDTSIKGEQEVTESVEEITEESLTENVEQIKKPFKEKIKDYVDATKNSAKNLRDTVSKAYDIVSEKGFTKEYTQEDAAVINEALKNIAKVVPQAAMAITPIPLTATGLQLLKSKSNFFKKLFTITRDALDEYISKETIEETTEDVIVDKAGQTSIDLDFKDHTKEKPFDDFMNEVEIEETPKPTQQSSEVKEGVSKVFKENSELAKIGTEQQYSEYLNSIFPDSKVKDIVYHSDTVQNKEFNKDKGLYGVFYFDHKVRKQHGKYIYTAMLDMKTPELVPTVVSMDNVDRDSVDTWKTRGADSILGSHKANDIDTDITDVKERVEYLDKEFEALQERGYEKEDTYEYIVFEPEQIHILGSKKDIQGFKKFVNQPAQQTSEVEGKNEISNDKNTDEQIKEQKEFTNSTIQDRIYQNPKLYKKIKKHFRKIFPNISVTEVDKLISQYGPQALARVVEKGIEIDTSRAFQNSIIHEYAHIYIKTLGKNNPLVKAGLEFIVGTQFYEDAKVMYPHLTEAEIREEALAEAMATDSYNKLKIKLDGTALEKFMAWAKKMWARIKSNFTKTKGNDIVSIIADGMTFRNSPIQYGSEFLTGMNKDQLVNPTESELTSYLSSELTTLRINKIIDPKNSFDPRSVNSITMNAYRALMNRYVKEKSFGPERIADNTIKLFDNVFIDLKQEESIQDTRENILSFYKMMQKDMPHLSTITNNTIESVSRVPVPKLEEVTDSAVKSIQKVSESARAVITSMVDYKGNLISADNIDRYVSHLATNTLGSRGFMQGLEEDAKDPNNIEAKRLNDMLANMSKGVRQSIVNELSSLIQIEYRNTVIKRNKDGGIVIGNTIKNSDQSLKTEKNELLQNLEQKSKSEKLLNWRKKNRSKIENRDVEAMELARQTIENAFDITLPWVQFNEYVDNMIAKKGNKRAFSNFLWSLGDVLNKTKSTKEISSYTQDLVQLSSDKQLLQKTFTNSKGNSVSSTRFGYWISELNSLMANQDNYLQEMKDSKLYRNNPIVNQLLKTKGQKQEWFVHDAISNSILNKVTEYGKQVNSDTIINGLSFFSNVASSDYYYQSIGISGNRDHVTYFKAPRYRNKEALQNQYEKSVNAEQMLFDNEVEGLEKNSLEYEDVVKKFNNMYMNKIVDGKVVTPWNARYPAKHTKDNKAKIKTIKKMVQKNGMTEAIQRDHVTNKKTYGDIDQLIESYFYTEAINREALMDIYASPALQKKNVEAAIKRGSGPNSGGSKIEFDKPVRIVVYKVPSKVVTKNPKALTSDSFTVDSPNLHAHIVEQSGDLGKVGANKKDFVYQVNPKTGKTLMMKMSTIGVTGEVGANNLNEMGDGYSRMGDAVIKAEAYFAEKGKDKSPYIKFVDSEVLKGNEGSYEVVQLEDLLTEIENDKFDLLEKSSFEQEIVNYRVAFNLNKDLTKVPLSEQSVTLATQLSTFVGNYATREELKVFKDAIVSSLKEKLGVKGDNYVDGKTYKKLKENKSFIDGLINSAGEQKSNSISSLINGIYEYNELNPNNQIKVFDDPNLVNLVQQFIATKFTKDGVRAEASGAYVHMLPDFDNTLKWYDNQGGIPEIAVPWSMFGTSLEEANKLLAKGPLKTVTVRVPASGPMSTFVAHVKYFTDGKANTVITPDEFVEASDADHDGDKTFVYRNDLNDNGTINEKSSKNKVFNDLFDRVSAEGMVKGTEQTLSLAPIKAVVDKWGFNKAEDYKLSDAVEVANVSEQMAFGNESVGIFAVASKLLSLLNQSQESLNNPIQFGYEMSKDENGKTIGKLANMQELKSFTDTQINDVARLLQAALDMGNDPILSSTGFNKYTIGVGNALSLLGQDLESIVGFLNNDVIVEFNKKIAETEGTFNNSESANKPKKETLEEYMSTISPEVGVFTTKESVESNSVITEQDSKNPVKEGIFSTADNKTYYTVSKIEDSENKFAVNIIAELLDHEVSIINKYNELQGVANDIKKLIPLVQLDNKLPNTGTDLRNLKQSFIDAKTLEFSTESLLETPLMNHYKNVVSNESNIFNNKFITENDFFVRLDKIFKKSLPFGINAGKKIRDSFMHQIAQEQLTKKHSNPQEFIDNFAESIKSMISSIRTGTVQHPLSKVDLEQVEFQIKKKEDNEFAWQESLIGVDEQWLAKYIPMMREYEATENSFQETLSYADNSFLKNISYKKNLVDEDGNTLTNLIQSKPEFRKATETIKKAVREDFLKLPQSMQDNFIDYQLLRHGLNDKIGSLMDMLPQDMKIKALVTMSEFSGNKKTHLDNNSDLIEKNTALSLFNQMTQDITTQEFKGDKVISLNKGKYVKMGNNLYEQTNEKELIGNVTYNVFDKITNDEFAVGKDFVKFGTEIQTEKASREDGKNLKNNC